MGKLIRRIITGLVLIIILIIILRYKGYNEAADKVEDKLSRVVTITSEVVTPE